MGALSSEMDINNYLTIEALEDGLTVSLSTNACEYCVDGDGNWKSLAADTTTEAINTGQTLSFRGELTPQYSTGIGTFTISKKYNLKGNCMSMLFGDEAIIKYSLSDKMYAFKSLFYNCTNVVNVSSNFLPATTLGSYCYEHMFWGCTSLTTAPELPATTIKYGCYSGMFGSCTSLTTAPELPATTLFTGCYDYMFKGCTSLITAPELPATTLADSCYDNMFSGCTSLVNAPELPATTLGSYCYDNMFYGCTSLTTAPELPATTLADNCYSYMFYGCTSLTVAPALPATTLGNRCCEYMFYGCTSLTTAPTVLPATTLTICCYQYMFYGCTSLTTAPALPATTLADYCYRHMFHKCTKLNYIKALFTTTPSTTYTSNWVNGVASTGTFVKNKDATWNVTGVHGIPEGWTVVNLITFTIDGTEYQAEEGMTWLTWHNTPYNTTDYLSTGHDSIIHVYAETYLYKGATKVKGTDIITSSAYTFK